MILHLAVGGPCLQQFHGVFSNFENSKIEINFTYTSSEQ